MASGHPDNGWVEEMQRRYPFFPLPAALALRAQAGEGGAGSVGGDSAAADDDGSRRADMLQRLALSAPDADAMQRMIGEADSRFDGFYPPEEKPRTPDTETAIDDFLSRYATTTPEEEALLERMIFNPVPEYARQLEQEARESLPEEPAPEGDSRDDRLNRFILSERKRAAASGVPTAEQNPVTSTAPQAATGEISAATSRVEDKVANKASAGQPMPLLSESLAKIYIKSHKYERAYEILSRLSLEFPEKNRYFADQLRFLRKLILNERARNVAEDTSK